MKNKTKKVPQENNVIELGTVYQVNKNIMKQFELVTDEYVTSLKEMLKKDFFKKNHFYMFLCRERYDYTVLFIQNSPETAVEDLFECIFNRGGLVEIELNEQGAYEVWLRILKPFTENEDEPKFEDVMYLLFPYDEGVLIS